MRLRVVAAIFVRGQPPPSTSPSSGLLGFCPCCNFIMPSHAAQFFITPVLLLAARFYYAPRSKRKEREKCWCAGKFFIPAKKKSRQKEGALAKNGLHVCRTIFTTSTAFLLASCVKKVTCVTQRFFRRRKEVMPVGYIRDSTRVHPS
jgi:hypothetical protein